MTQQEKQKQIEEMAKCIEKLDDTENQDNIIYSQTAYLSTKEIAETLINSGYGDTKQAVREFAKMLKDAIIADSAYIDVARAPQNLVNTTWKVVALIKELIKETCGE